MRIALIIVAGSNRQNECFFPSYEKISAGMPHDLIVVHRDRQFLKDIFNKDGCVILENKIIDGKEVPHRAFGAYRHFWNLYKDRYDAFGFISDDVIVKAEEWVKRSIDLLFQYDRLGLVGTQIMNGSLGQYPHPSHNRAPCWFAKSRALKDIDWSFDSDHSGEMVLADQFVAVNYFAAQVGNKIDVAYDSMENGGYYAGDHIASCWETSMQHDLRDPFTKQEQNRMSNTLMNRLESGDDSLTVQSPHPHIGVRKVISQLQPFHGLLYDRSEGLGGMYCNHYPFGIQILKGMNG